MAALLLNFELKPIDHFFMHRLSLFFAESLGIFVFLTLDFPHKSARTMHKKKSYRFRLKTQKWVARKIVEPISI